MRNLDRLQPYETHKIGVLFVGHGQVSTFNAKIFIAVPFISFFFFFFFEAICIYLFAV